MSHEPDPPEPYLNESRRLGGPVRIFPDFGTSDTWRWGAGISTAAYAGLCDYVISDQLNADFEQWQREFERNADNLMFDWQMYNLRGLELSRRLHAEIGDQVEILYERPYEDPRHRTGEQYSLRDLSSLARLEEELRNHAAPLALLLLPCDGAPLHVPRPHDTSDLLAYDAARSGMPSDLVERLWSWVERYRGLKPDSSDAEIAAFDKMGRELAVEVQQHVGDRYIVHAQPVLRDQIVHDERGQP